MFAALMPLAVEEFDLSYFDVVISNSASFAKGVITKPFRVDELLKVINEVLAR